MIWSSEEPIPPFNIKDVDNWASGQWNNGVWRSGDSYNDVMSINVKVRFAQSTQIKFNCSTTYIDTYNQNVFPVTRIGFYDSNQNFISEVGNSYNKWANVPNEAKYYTITVRMTSGNTNRQTQLNRINPSIEFL